MIRSTLILGSTSVVAQALAEQLAASGCRRFHLLARHQAANQRVAEGLRQRYGCEVILGSLDLESAARGAPLPLPLDPVDLVLVTAGAIGDTNLASQDPAEALAITTATYTGLLPWLVALTAPERLESPGRLWVFSSVAGDRGRPSNYPYGAAKAALTTFCEGLLLRCHGKPFAVRIIKAGYMATPMAVAAPAALCIQPQRVARILLRRPDRRGIEYLPWWWMPIMLLVRLLPSALAAKL
ncbi:SDR family NAD(P)-dependent oxidoreductase [Synechococcus sp. CBW1107]|uniref:SDR family NAD(P)-dependent oxidoreductase n=1 Tax=Synechococcus sp. CBW1107 TaxID=2789857 RepID=UPI002AD3521F|nr:SDR family NAD(P)-dependent oxidoreductase [Synechococcus sp. CBW1107]CAK6696910.1 putative oxidoreductase [Synechococcus sp. CBW1107]